MVLLAVLIYLSSSPRWCGTAGVIGLTLLGLVFLIAGSQEPALWRTLRSLNKDPLDLAIVVLGVLGILLSLLLLVFGILELVKRWRGKKPVNPY